MTFHTSRFGGSLVSQTSRFMSGYTGLVDVTVYSLIPHHHLGRLHGGGARPVVPTFTVILVGIMVVYIAFVWLMYKRIMPLSAATSPRRTNCARRAVRRGHEHPGRQDLRARGL